MSWPISSPLREDLDQPTHTLPKPESDSVPASEEDDTIRPMICEVDLGTNRRDNSLTKEAGAIRPMVREILETLLFTLLIFFLVRSVIQNFKVDGNSMEPNLHTGQYIMVNRIVYFHVDLNFLPRLLTGAEDLEPNLAYLFHLPRRGDIVVFEYPRDTSRDFIKRVIGLPGETIEIHNGQVLIDGAPLSEPYLTDSARTQMSSMPPVKVPLDAVFVMGDNRGNSSDSRSWGSLPLDRIVGKAWFTYWPREYWGAIPHAEPTLAAP